MKNFMNLRTISVLLTATAVPLLLSSMAGAAPCVDCHTMHNSQDGISMQWDDVNNGGTNLIGPQDALLRGTCVACHTGTNDGTNTIPYVYSTSPPTYSVDGTAGADTLAGGSFYWVALGGTTNDPFGHNVATDGLAAADGNFTNPLIPPGSATALDSQLTCAGTTGCHGDRSIANDFGAMQGTHHADDTTIDGSSPGTSYRFLDGVLGLEDSDWEYQPLAGSHNQYYGIDRTSDATASIDGATISSLCAQCHEDFHNGAGNVQGTVNFTNPWVRHPTDFNMANAVTAVGAGFTEYGYYGGASGGTGAYVVSAPVASTDVSAVLSTVDLSPSNGSDNTIVTCISCHRAHGTPNADLLRWDYSLMDAGGGGTGGCFECHTTKN